MTESEWTRLVCAKLTTAGAICIAHPMGKMISHTPDRSIISVHGNYFVEFKAARTAIRPGQALMMRQLNERVRCAFVYRFPNMLTIEGLIAYVDALEKPLDFLQALRKLAETTENNHTI